MSSKLFPTTMRRYLRGVGCSLALAAGCAGGGDDASPAGESGVAEGEAVSLVPTLAVVVRGDSVRFTLRVANNGQSPVDLQFGSAQRFDFVVRDAAGAEVWRWSADRMFSQVVGEERVEAGAVLEYGASWDAGGRSGAHRAVARLVSSDRPVELVTDFELGE